MVDKNIIRIIRRLKIYAKILVGKELLVKPTTVCAQKKRFGSDYGGWIVDTSSLDNQSIVYSFGIGEDASFDISLIEYFKLTLYAFDPTPKSIDWVKRQDFSDRFVMHTYGIAALDGNVSFYPPVNPNHVSHTLLDRPLIKGKSISVQVKRLGSIMNELRHSKIDLLKMDIEGAEYDVIDDINKSGIRPHQILVEFHHRFPGVGIKRTKDAIENLNTMGYQIFSISDSNEEFGFIQNKI